MERSNGNNMAAPNTLPTTLPIIPPTPVIRPQVLDRADIAHLPAFFQNGPLTVPLEPLEPLEPAGWETTEWETNPTWFGADETPLTQRPPIAPTNANIPAEDPVETWVRRMRERGLSPRPRPPPPPPPTPRVLGRVPLNRFSLREVEPFGPPREEFDEDELVMGIMYDSDGEEEELVHHAPDFASDERRRQEDIERQRRVHQATGGVFLNMMRRQGEAIERERRRRRGEYVPEPIRVPRRAFVPFIPRDGDGGVNMDEFEIYEDGDTTHDANWGTPPPLPRQPIRPASDVYTRGFRGDANLVDFNGLDIPEALEAFETLADAENEGAGFRRSRYHANRIPNEGDEDSQPDDISSGESDQDPQDYEDLDDVDDLELSVYDRSHVHLNTATISEEEESQHDDSQMMGDDQAPEYQIWTPEMIRRRQHQREQQEWLEERERQQREAEVVGVLRNGIVTIDENDELVINLTMRGDGTNELFPEGWDQYSR